MATASWFGLARETTATGTLDTEYDGRGLSYTANDVLFRHQMYIFLMHYLQSFVIDIVDYDQGAREMISSKYDSDYIDINLRQVSNALRGKSASSA